MNTVTKEKINREVCEEQPGVFDIGNTVFQLIFFGKGSSNFSGGSHKVDCFCQTLNKDCCFVLFILRQPGLRVSAITSAVTARFLRELHNLDYITTKARK